MILKLPRFRDLPMIRWFAAGWREEDLKRTVTFIYLLEEKRLSGEKLIKGEDRRLINLYGWLYDFLSREGMDDISRVRFGVRGASEMEMRLSVWTVALEVKSSRLFDLIIQFDPLWEDRKIEESGMLLGQMLKVLGSGEEVVIQACNGEKRHSCCAHPWHRTCFSIWESNNLRAVELKEGVCQRKPRRL